MPGDVTDNLMFKNVPEQPGKDVKDAGVHGERYEDD